MLSCYDAQLSYDSRIDTFRARYRKRVLMDFCLCVFIFEERKFGIMLTLDGNLSLYYQFFVVVLQIFFTLQLKVIDVKIEFTWVKLICTAELWN